ncbi:MAG: carboxypeptidase regulatory-like domain-containing protein [Nonlabens sp.]|uniref:carboxypeptidase regulatory-like domain-containing protein n=1 Tax=Nonlabens sp. TaxID=1888209 RepID=UPI003EF0E09C
MKLLQYIAAITILLLVSGCSEDKLQINGKGTLKGRVVADETFLPQENVKISTNPNTNTVFTDADGMFEFELENGQYSVQAEKDGFLTDFESATVEVDATVEVVFELKVETANNRPPATPVLTVPEDNEVDVASNVTLEWTATDPEGDDLTFTVELRNTSTNTIEVFEDITEPMLDVTVEFGTTYLWQVRSNDGINQDINSATFSFSTTAFPTNRFLFVRKVNGNNVIYSGDDNGTEVALTSSTTNSWRPRINRQAGKIAFLRNVGAAVHVFTMNPDGSQEQQVTSTVAVSGFNLDEIDISWATNGSLIYYPSLNKLYTIQPSGAGLSLFYQTSNGNLITEVDVNEPRVAIKTNDFAGYNVEILVLDMQATVIETVISGMAGAAGSVNLSADNTKVLYTRDISGFENIAYRQLDSRLFVYTFSTSVELDVSFNKPIGTNDLDARFSPTEGLVICMNQDNDGNSAPLIQSLELSIADTREDLFTNAIMPDWE